MVMNILIHTEVNNDFERYKIKEFVYVLFDEMIAKFGNKVVSDRSKYSPMNKLIGVVIGGEAPSIINILGDITDENLKTVADGISKWVINQNYKIK